MGVDRRIELIGQPVEPAAIVINPESHQRAEFVNIEEPALDQIADCRLRIAD